jgi:fatty-acyl-CoA synthase
VAEREGAKLLVHDEEYASLVEGFEPPLGRFRAWADSPGDDTLDALIASGSPSAPRKPAEESRIIVLTSGTTGTPKGANRGQPRSLAPIGALLCKVPFKSEEVTLIAAPLFHALGFAHGVLAVGLGSTQVLRRKFDPQQVLEDMSRHRVTAGIFVPVMMQRILNLGPEAREGLDFSAFRIAFMGGSQLGGELCERITEAFGPVVYNLYGSTEVAYATIATPEELADAPASVGTPPRGATVRLYDEAGKPVSGVGKTGRIFVGNGFEFEGYTGGGGKEVIDGLMSSGDVGHFDERGRLFIDGRDDDMIVSGGENVFPAEIEECLAHHEAVREVSAIGVDDDEWGKRLRVFVVLHDGASMTEDEVKAHVRENLARFKTPRDVVFLDALPRNPTGKVLKRELAALEPA